MKNLTVYLITGLACGIFVAYFTRHEEQIKQEAYSRMYISTIRQRDQEFLRAINTLVKTTAEAHHRTLVMEGLQYELILRKAGYKITWDNQTEQFTFDQ